ncbi:protein FAM184A [Senna tora]|uniref:Protein FAM184A n=1 Tax=Senna tora TaxID=362788 RepID=A0A835CF39_9FABA|nr:protein FAM184A [Senna tora]
MVLSSAFHERLQHMDRTRNQRLSQLQAEKELQAKKSVVLASKLADIRSMEQRCFVFDHKVASKSFKILALKSGIENLEAKLETGSQEMKSLRSEVEELEELEKSKDSFYETKRKEMMEFKENVEKFVVECQVEVENLRHRANELRASFMELKRNNKNSCNWEISAAELRRSELVAAKENLDRKVASNYQIKAQLQKQLQNILMTQAQERSKPSQAASPLGSQETKL